VDSNGKTYFIDGGKEYLRMSSNGDEKLTKVTTDSPHELVRSNLLWGTYGPLGDLPLNYILLKDLTDAHLKKLVESYISTSNPLHPLFSKEVEYRNEA
jgi:hypothetical protein